MLVRDVLNSSDNQGEQPGPSTDKDCQHCNNEIGLLKKKLSKLTMKMGKIKGIIESNKEDGSDGSSIMDSTAVSVNESSCDDGITCAFCGNKYKGSFAKHVCPANHSN